MDAHLPRRSFLRSALGLAAGAAFAGCRADPPASPSESTAAPGATPAPGASPAASSQTASSQTASSQTDRMPALFLGHGSPMNAIEENQWSRAFRALGATLPKPRAILCVSAHWYIRGTATTIDARPRTIHDFGGFPKALEEMLYDVPGDPDLAKRVVAILGPGRSKARDDWGLDHGTWSVLHHIRPDRDVPVVQLSIDRQADGARHIEIAKAVGALRDEGVLILGSGNVTHNLRHAMAAGDTVPDWATRFDASVAEATASGDTKYLATALASQDGARSHPTPDHYIPVLYGAGSALPGDRVTFPITGFAGSLSMRAIQWS